MQTESENKKHLQIRHLQPSLSKVVSTEDIQQSLGSIVDALSDVIGVDEASFLEPGSDLLLVLLIVLWTKFVADDEASHGDAALEEVELIDGELGLLGWWEVVLGDGAADNETTHDLHVLESPLRSWATNVVVVDVDSVGSNRFDELGCVGGLVVEGVGEFQGILEVGDLLVRSSGTNNGETFVKGDLADERSNSSGGSSDENDFSLLWLSNTVEGRVGGKTRHTECSKEVVLWEAVWVLERTDLRESVLSGDDLVLGGVLKTGNNITLLEAWGVGFQDLGDGVVGDGLTKRESWGVRWDLWVTHAAALISMGGVSVWAHRTGS